MCTTVCVSGFSVIKHNVKNLYNRAEGPVKAQLNDQVSLTTIQKLGRHGNETKQNYFTAMTLHLINETDTLCLCLNLRFYSMTHKI